MFERHQCRRDIPTRSHDSVIRLPVLLQVCTKQCEAQQNILICRWILCNMAYVFVHNLGAKYTGGVPAPKVIGKNSKGHWARFWCATVEVAHNGICIEVYKRGHSGSCRKCLAIFQNMVVEGRTINCNEEGSDKEGHRLQITQHLSYKKNADVGHHSMFYRAIRGSTFRIVSSYVCSTTYNGERGRSRHHEAFARTACVGYFLRRTVKLVLIIILYHWHGFGGYLKAGYVILQPHLHALHSLLLS